MQLGNSAGECSLTVCMRVFWGGGGAGEWPGVQAAGPQLRAARPGRTFTHTTPQPCPVPPSLGHGRRTHERRADSRHVPRKGLLPQLDSAFPGEWLCTGTGGRYTATPNPRCCRYHGLPASVSDHEEFCSHQMRQSAPMCLGTLVRHMELDPLSITRED